MSNQNTDYGIDSGVLLERIEVLERQIRVIAEGLELALWRQVFDLKAQGQTDAADEAEQSRKRVYRSMRDG